MIDTYIAALADYAVSKKLIEPLDRTWAINRLLPPLGLSAYEEPAAVPNLSLEEILTALTQYAVEQGLAASDVTSRDLFDSSIPSPPRPPRTGTTASARTRTISAATASQRTRSGSPLHPTAIWTSPSISPSRRRTPVLSPPPRRRLRAAIPSASSAGRTRGTPGGSTTPPVRTTASFPS